MSAYEALAASYDALTYDIPYEKILQFWETLLKRYRLRPETVLDLAAAPAPSRCFWRSMGIA